MLQKVLQNAADKLHKNVDSEEQDPHGVYELIHLLRIAVQESLQPVNAAIQEQSYNASKSQLVLPTQTQPSNALVDDTAMVYAIPEQEQSYNPSNSKLVLNCI